MNIFRAIFRSRDRPENHIGDKVGGGRFFPFGWTWAGKSVTERTAMQTTAVYACVRIISETVASLPLHLYEYTDDGKEKVYTHPLYRLLHDIPNPEMSIFFTDLDNTMIYSHHRGIGKPKIVVEHLDGKEQSFMTEFSYDFLSSADWLEIVPVTTRTKQQYDRIECSEKLRFKYAIVCNGGKLLVDGQEDLEWSDKTDVLVRENYESLEQATELLSKLCHSETMHRPEKYMSYVKCFDPESVYAEFVKAAETGT